VGTSTGASTGTNTNATNGTAVAGFQSPPSNAVGAVSPIVQTPGSAGNVAGVQGLPSTSTGSGPAIPLAALGLALMAVGGAILRRGTTQA
jgi:hypothetical protein